MSAAVQPFRHRSRAGGAQLVTARGASSRAFVRMLAVVVTMAVAGSAATGSYTIRQGDTLSSIAARHGVSSRSLATLNGLRDPNRVVTGRTLQIPASGPAATNPSATSTYTIRSGDTLSGIAARTGIGMAALASANGIADPDRLVIGRTLRLPGAGRAASPATAPAPVVAGASAPAGLPSRLRQSPTRLAYIPIFERWAAHHGVPADLLMAMTWLESGWQQGAVSPTGAVGVGQIMPDTTAWMRDHLIGGPLDPHDVNDNIRMSARYLSWLLDRTGGDVRLALGGYYQGLNAVRTRGLLPETERYVADIVALRDRSF